MVHIAIDFGGTNIKLGLVEQGNLLCHASLAAYSSSGLIGRLAEVEQAVDGLLDSKRLSLDNCSGIGVSMPGLVDPKTQTVLSIHEKYSDAVGFDFAAWAASYAGLPLVMENDARAALIGETAYGSGRGETDAVLMIFGTGIGTAAMINGQVLRGKHFQAGVLGGHLTADARGHWCNCGNRGCLEEYASHRTLLKRLKDRKGYHSSVLAESDSLNYLTIIQAAQGGDGLAASFLEELIEYWSGGIINLIHAYDPETVILSGGLMKSAELLLPRISEKVNARAWTPWGKVRFIVAENPESSVMLGLSRLLDNEKVE